MRHVEIAASASSRSDIEQRLTGRFYTPTLVAKRLAEATFAYGSRPATVGDPFCGDGRLIVAWLNAAHEHAPLSLKSLRRVVLWDYDGDAVRVATERVAALLRSLGLSRCDIDARQGDTFETAAREPGSIDVVLTNPPWELLKPDARDGVGSVQAQYTESLRGYAARVARQFPEAVSAKGKAMTGYGVNLARAGALASVQLVARGGALAVVLPASIFGDQASAPFRGAVFGRARADALDWFPAESKLFDGVDQPFVTCVAQVTGAPTDRFELVRHGPDLSVVEKRDVQLTSTSEPVSFSVGGEQAEVVSDLLREHPKLRWLEEDLRFGLWLGRELDETRIAESFTSDARVGVRFLKGRHVFPWEVRWDEELWIDPRKRQIPRSVSEQRLAWRDVSRPTQRRRMHVALVPDGAVTGNSLGVAFFRYGERERIRVLLAILNSFSFEVQVRTLLSTAHVSQGILRQCAVPEAAFGNAKVARTLAAAANLRMSTLQETPEVEVAVAQAYGLDRDGMEVVLGAFPKVTPQEKALLLERHLWL